MTSFDYHRLPLLCAPLPLPLAGMAADFLGAVVEVEPPAVCHLDKREGKECQMSSISPPSSSSSPTQSLKFKLTDAESLLGLIASYIS